MWSLDITFQSDSLWVVKNSNSNKIFKDYSYARHNVFLRLSAPVAFAPADVSLFVKNKSTGAIIDDAILFDPSMFVCFGPLFFCAFFIACAGTELTVENCVLEYDGFLYAKIGPFKTLFSKVRTQTALLLVAKVAHHGEHIVVESSSTFYFVSDPQLGQNVAKVFWVC